MTTSPFASAEPSPEATAAAVESLRATEAARILGLLAPVDLKERASGWILNGLDSPSIWSLASGDYPMSDEQRDDLVSRAAGECGIAVGSVSEARTIQAMTIVQTMSQGDYSPVAVYHLSNQFTDEMTGRGLARIREWFRRRRG